MFAHPSAADLTADVDFEQLAEALSSASPSPIGGLQLPSSATAGAAPALSVLPAVTQQQFLQAMGLPVRLGMLLRSASSAQARKLRLDAEQLLSPQYMGSRFKMLGVQSAGLPPPPVWAPAA